MVPRPGRESRSFSFAVIAGSLKGKKISAPDLGVTRPPLTRLRKSIFDFLNPYLADAAYLDLFSGTGSYLFEAISRGAAKALGVELEPQLAEAINDQAQAFGINQQMNCVCGDVFAQIPKLAAKKLSYDVIMIAPPQYKGLIGRTLLLLGEKKLAAPGGLILCQRDSAEKINSYPDGFTLFQERKYGNTTFTILQSAQ